MPVSPLLSRDAIPDSRLSFSLLAQNSAPVLIGRLVLSPYSLSCPQSLNGHSSIRVVACCGMSPVLCLTEHQCAGVQIRKVIPRASWASWLYACFYIYMDDVKGSRNPAASMKPVTIGVLSSLVIS
jgi:hypothetical protein